VFRWVTAEFVGVTTQYRTRILHSSSTA